jgi:hypothetical protein
MPTDSHPLVAVRGDSHLLALLSNLRRLRACKVQLKGSTLSGLHHLTRLVLHSSTVLLQPGALAALTQLQHLAVMQSKILSDYGVGTVEDTAAAGMQQLLLDLSQLQQLTYLDLGCSRAWHCCPSARPGPEAYSALTASSMLQHLNISNCCLPEGVWEHIFPSDRQLPNLRTLDISWVLHPAQGTLLVLSLPGPLLPSCCPGLQSLSMKGMEDSTEGISALQGLSSLWHLALGPNIRAHGLPLWRGGQAVLPKLTVLQRLSIVALAARLRGCCCS